MKIILNLVHGTYLLLYLWALLCVIVLVNINDIRMMICSLIGAIIAVAVIFGIWKISEKWSGNIRNSRKFYIVSAVLLLIFEIVWVYSFYFWSGWDVQILRETAMNLAHGEDISYQMWYFTRYPNNIFLTEIFAGIFSLFHQLGIHQYEYAFLLVVSCLLNTLTGYLSVLNTKKITGNSAAALFCGLMYLLLVGLSPWTSIPYSDSFGLLFPTVVMFIYLHMDSDRASVSLVKWLLISAVSFVGFKVKPQTFIVFIALVMIQFVSLIAKKKYRQVGRTVLSLSGVIIGLAISFILSSAVIHSSQLYVANNTQEFGLQHFFMMGLNDTNHGVYLEEDVNYSKSFATVEERKKADIDRALERINHYGFDGMFDHVIQKTDINFSDGTFGWAGEGNFFIGFSDHSIPLVSDISHAIYYQTDELSEITAVWKFALTSIWLALICMTLHRKRRDEKTAVMELALIGLFIFELLFEARARYFYIYVPIFIVLCATPLSTVKDTQEDK